MHAGSHTKLNTTVGVLVFAVLVRALTIFVGWAGLYEDIDSYARLAVNWSESGVLGFQSATGEAVRATAFRPPLYPWLLSFMVADGELLRGWVALLHLTLGLASVWLTLSIAQRLQLRWAWLAALAVALDPLLVRAGQLVMTETLATFLALLAWRLWLYLWPSESVDTASGGDRLGQQSRATRRPGYHYWLGLAALGLVFGLATLARPTAAPWAALCVACLLLVGSASWKRRLIDAAIVALGVMVCVVPWTLRNMRELGKPIWGTSHGGYTLLLANNPSIYQHFMHHGPSRDWGAEPFHAAWSARRFHEAGELLGDDYWLREPLAGPVVEKRTEKSEDATDELADDALAYVVAKSTIARQPATFVLSIVYRVGWLWAPWPNAPMTAPSTIVIGLWYVAWFTLAAVGLARISWRKQLSSWLPALLLLLTLTAVHAVYWSNMRMRGPAMPAIYLLAAAGLSKKVATDEDR